MDTIKTAAVVALLLAVLYGIYVVLTREEPAPPPEVTQALNEFNSDEALVPPTIDMGNTHTDHSSDQPPGDAAARSDSKQGSQPRIFVQVEPPSALGTQGLEQGSSTNELPAADAARAPTAPARTAPVADVITSTSVPIPSPITPPPPSSISSGTDFSSGIDSARDGAVDPTQPPVPIRLPPAHEGTNGSNRDSGGTVVTGWASTSPSSETSELENASKHLNHDSTFNDTSSRYGAASGVSNSAALSGHGTTEVGQPPDAGIQQGDTSGRITGLTESTRQARQLVEQGQYREALQRLSAAYIVHQAQAGLSERQAALDLLDPLAAAVIYSHQHWLEPPYRVRAGQTLDQIATAYQIPTELLQNINRISDPESLLPGTELKVVRGPFRAEVELSRNEMTLYLSDLYAGRFPISVGSDPSPIPGEYLVLNKQHGRTYYAADGRTLPPHDPMNPYGSVWLDLGTRNLCIHGSPKASVPAISNGCISLSPKDAEDIYAILSIGSRVTIRP